MTVVKVFPAVGRVSFAVRESGGRYAAELVLDCAAHGRTETVWLHPDRVMGDQYKAVAAAAIAAVSRDRDEYQQLRRTVIDPVAGWWVPIPAEPQWFYLTYGTLSQYYRVFVDPYVVLRRLIETAPRVQHGGWSEDWDIFLPTGERVDRVRVDSEIRFDWMGFACRGLVLVPSVAAVARSCHEFKVLCRAAWDAAGVEARAAGFPHMVNGTHLYPVLAAVSRGVLGVISNVDGVLLG